MSLYIYLKGRDVMKLGDEYEARIGSKSSFWRPVSVEAGLFGLHKDDVFAAEIRVRRLKCKK